MSNIMSMKKMRIVTICILMSILGAVPKSCLLFAQNEPDVQKASSEAQGVDETNKAPTLSAPVLEIKRLEAKEPLYSIELRDVELSDLFRVIAHDYNFNILMDEEVSGKITASFTNISLEEALAGIAEMSNLVLAKKGNIIKVSPNLITKTFILKSIEARQLLESSVAGGAQAATTTKAAQQTSTIYDLLSDKGKVLIGEQQNSIVVIDYPSYVEKIEGYLKEIDQKMASRVFKLKYLKASDVVGEADQAQASSTGGAQGSSSAPTSTTSGSH